jgi:hypothetical protein
LTTAQKLNGIDPQPIEWNGSFSVTFPAARQIGVTYGDPSWRENSGLSMNMKKIKGKWDIYTESQYGRLPVVPIKSCSEIPQK